MNYGRQYIDKEDIRAVGKVLKSDFLTQGPKVEEFEEKLAEYVRAKYCVCVNSGTSALHLAVKVLNRGCKIERGYTSANSFVASANCMKYEKIHVELGDIDLETFNMLPVPETELVILVHFAGFPITYRPDGLVIEDGCHALGARGVGSCEHSRMTCFSFHPVKTITTGEGGAITTNSDYYYRELKELRNHGVSFIGYNYRMPDINAALGISQLKKINQFIYRRQEIFRNYNGAFDGLFKTPVYSDDSSCHLYVAWFNKRDEIREYLKKINIGTQIHYQPIYHQREYGIYQGFCPNAELYAKHALSLPLYPGMTREDVYTVIKGVEDAVKSCNERIL